MHIIDLVKDLSILFIHFRDQMEPQVSMEQPEVQEIWEHQEKLEPLVYQDLSDLEWVKFDWSWTLLIVKWIDLWYKYIIS